MPRRLRLVDCVYFYICVEEVVHDTWVPITPPLRIQQEHAAKLAAAAAAAAIPPLPALRRPHSPVALPALVHECAVRKKRKFLRRECSVWDSLHALLGDESWDEK